MEEWIVVAWIINLGIITIAVDDSQVAGAGIQRFWIGVTKPGPQTICCRSGWPSGSWKRACSKADIPMGDASTKPSFHSQWPWHRTHGTPWWTKRIGRPWLNSQFGNNANSGSWLFVTLDLWCVSGAVTRLIRRDAMCKLDEFSKQSYSNFMPVTVHP